MVTYPSKILTLENGDRIIDWFRLRDGEYVKLQPDEQNIIKSEVFADLWLGINLILDYDLSQVIQIVQQGLATEENQEFIGKFKNE